MYLVYNGIFLPKGSRLKGSLLLEVQNPLLKKAYFYLYILLDFMDSVRNLKAIIVLPLFLWRGIFFSAVIDSRSCKFLFFFFF